MSHLGDKLADYVYQELPADERRAAEEHVSACAACRSQVEEFERLQHALKALPSEDVPRRLVFMQPEHARAAWTPWRWLAPAGAALALVLALLLITPLQMQWGGPGQVAGGAPGALQPADYDAIVERVRAELRLEAEAASGALEAVRREAVALEAWRLDMQQQVQVLDARDVERGKEIRRVRTDIDYLAAIQLADRKEAYETASAIQLALAGGVGAQE